MSHSVTLKMTTPEAHHLWQRYDVVKRVKHDPHGCSPFCLSVFISQHAPVTCSTPASISKPNPVRSEKNNMCEDYKLPKTTLDRQYRKLNSLAQLLLLWILSQSNNWASVLGLHFRLRTYFVWNDFSTRSTTQIIHTHTHVCLHMCVCVCVCVCNHKNKSLQLELSLCCRLPVPAIESIQSLSQLSNSPIRENQEAKPPVQ